MRIVILIDGGYLRAETRRAGLKYDVDFIENFSRGCVHAQEYPLRFMYYDCPPYQGTVTLPISGGKHQFSGSDAWLRELARRELFAVRNGVLKFRGYVPRHVPVAHTPLSDADFRPNFEQKGVDMRIGLDIATFSENRSVDRILLVSGDTDCVPAMKHARKAGLQVVLARLPGAHLAPELLEHADFDRHMVWPVGATAEEP